MTNTTDLPLPSLDDVTWAFDATDELLVRPYIDVSEERATPVPHHYVHGGFDGTDTRFSFYFPSASVYRNRFFQHVTPFPQNEHLAPTGSMPDNKIVFAHASGAYFVETNGGGAAAGDPRSGVDPAISAYRANASVARFSRTVAAELYGPGRVYGYLYGGSGGGYRTIASSENTIDVWDGYAPHVIGSSMAIPNVFSVRMHALRVLRGRMAEIVDAFDAGGDPAAIAFTPAERAAFDEVTRMGFPPRSWFGWKTMDLHGFSALYPGVLTADPTYPSDFWSLEGYLGADPDAEIHADRVAVHTRIVELIREDAGADAVSGGVDESFKHVPPAASARVIAVRLADAPHGWILGAELHVVGGAAKGSVIRLSGVDGDIALVEGWQAAVPAALAVGDEVLLDNSNFLAVQTYHRHQVPGPEFAVWDQFRAPDGTPRYPQRPMLLGPLLTRGATGAEMTGRIGGKVIVVASLLDREAYPWQADWYRRLVEAEIGVEEAEDRLRLWYVDHALHGDEGPQEFPDRTVTYLGVLDTALRQLVAWVEDGVEPSSSTQYRVDDGQVVLVEGAARGGVQPLVGVAVDGAERTRVRPGDAVDIAVVAEAVEGVVVDVVVTITGPDGLVADAPVAVETPAARVEGARRWVADAEGTFFVAARVVAQTGGDVGDPHARAQDIARARIVVQR